MASAIYRAGLILWDRFSFSRTSGCLSNRGISSSEPLHLLDITDIISLAVSAVQTKVADVAAAQGKIVQEFQGIERLILSASNRSTELVIKELNRKPQAQTSDVIPRLDSIYAISMVRNYLYKSWVLF